MGKSVLIDMAKGDRGESPVEREREKRRIEEGENPILLHLCLLLVNLLFLILAHLGVWLFCAADGSTNVVTQKFNFRAFFLWNFIELLTVSKLCSKKIHIKIHKNQHIIAALLEKK